MTLPAYLQNLPSRNLAQTALDNAGASMPPYLSIEGSRFTLVDAAGGTMPIDKLTIDVVIVDINEHVSQTYFDPSKPFDPANPEPPLCFSDNGVAPSAQAREPQSPTCAACPKQQWGKINTLGNKVPWCQRSQKIAIWPFEHSPGLFMLKLPPNTAFGAWKDYMQKFKVGGLEPDHVVTRISFSGTGTLAFAALGYITEAMVPKLSEMVASKATDALVGRLDRPRQGALPAPQTQSPLPPPTESPLPPATQASAPMPASPFMQQAPQPTAQVAPAERGRRGRRKNADQPAAQPQQQAPFAQAAPVTQPAPFALDGQGPAAQFGIAQTAPPPPPGLDLDAIFKS